MKKKSKKKKTKKSSSDDKPSAAAKSKSRKEKKVLKLADCLEKSNRVMIEMAAELRELRGIPTAIQRTFDEQQRSEASQRRNRRNGAVGIITTEGPARNE